MLRDIERNGHDFVIDDTPITRSWSFWDLWASGKWEPGTLDAIKTFLAPNEWFFDIGAWVGPMALWAAKSALARVVAVEPDPVAFDILNQNRHLNPALDIQLVDAALGTGDAIATELFYDEGQQGDSTTSMTRTTSNRSLIARVVTLDELVGRFGRPSLLKMDIEGGESLVLPVVGPKLRELKCPMILALHPQWYAPHGQRDVEQELSYWKIERIAGENIMCWPTG